MVLSVQFREAAMDYLYLLEHNYPQKAIIKLIGDRHSLSGTERTMLYRGLTTSANRHSRSSRLVEANTIKNQDLHVDGYNVLISIGSYLNGSLVFIANDNLLRDASEIHGKVFRTRLFDRGIRLILDYARLVEVASLNFYFDRPVSKSGALAANVNDVLMEQSFPGNAMTTRSPDHQLKNLEHGIVCTSDSTIIDTTSRQVFDLARHALEHHFKPDFLNLCELA